MSEQLVVVISGVGRGIGNALAQSYLTRPNCTVVGSVRDENAPGVAALQSTAQDNNPKLLVVKIESASDTDAKDAVEMMKAAGIDHIDILIANAGVSPPIIPLETESLAAIESAFRVNALGSLALYQACHPLLMKSGNPKFVAIGSAAASIGAMGSNHAWVAPAYCISKSALNWITVSAHHGNDRLIAVAVNPGLVDSDMGNKTAREHMGLDRAPVTMADCAEKITKLVDEATRETTSGKFIHVIDGTEIQW
ncbi:aflatoxin biosynthesis ketoreductase nor-1 [Apiospora hydei]|uniref:Aflatoxin biosynthesis ketoreductase nor-1 n=1 Tax=Apiospora hydei TaxID=1337664 RepID=A0ABR1VJH3_9PEZI